ncbi:GNAT family N-acetyltransferase [Pseudomonas agarici]|uniref:GNAT family N-acetyltransferase n=1 Tax=Pseudomonas agarici TaxID=46677 RepID=UPI0002F4F662|nr:GNAT family N-acetyltransferase [Pseudomonas agarici]NWB94066.1 GNAT family N-acetyltransferase [Pseudomonas agarici]NWC11787.1 GNAT family N-acetyltransferase [Pseudomonas agarici]SEL84678.1 Acetyltransferase (GNAT) family protein [Pseudomonas agarici]
MQTRLACYYELSPLQREQLDTLQVHPEQLPFCGDIHCALYFLPPDPHAGVKGLVLLDGEIPVGFLLLKLYPLVPHWAGPGSVTVHAVQVDKRAQGRGLGSAFMRALPDTTRRLWPQALELVLSVGADNPNAMGFYLRQGWVDTGEAYLGERCLKLRL